MNMISNHSYVVSRRIRHRMSLWCIVLLTAAALLPACTPEATAETERVMMPMRDGVKLATELYFPEEEEGPWPVVLVRTPYGIKRQAGYGHRFSEQGYVVAIQDVRGSSDSEGECWLWVHEREDGYDAVEWLAAQDWSTGKIGMIGGSYGGWVPLAAAVEKPPHLVTIVSRVPMADPFFNHVYPYGMFHQTQHLQALAIFSEFLHELPTISLPPDWKNQLDNLPVRDHDRRIYGQEVVRWREDVQHNMIDAYWEGTDLLADLAEVDIPVYIQGGWLDFGGIGTKLSYLHLARSDNQNIKLLIGPWSHGLEGTSSIGGQEFGAAAEMDVLGDCGRWFDHWLRGIDNGIADESLVKVFNLGPNYWLEGDRYPLPQTQFVEYYLASDQGARTTRGDGVLQRSVSSAGNTSDTYSYDPGDPTPSLWWNAVVAYDSLVAARDDILVFETEPFADSFMVVGPVSATLYASTSGKDTDWVVYWRIIDADSGKQFPMGRAPLRARFRNSARQPELLEPDEVYEYTFDLWHMGVTITPGSKIRLEITSACFPDFSRNLNTGGNNEHETEYITASQRIYHSEEYPSHLLLPVIEFEEE